MTPEERARAIYLPYSNVNPRLRGAIAAAIRAAVEAERNGCELVALRYRDRMAGKAVALQASIGSSVVATSKADAAESIAAAIRERKS